jgi:hypothetical protein
MQGNEVQVTHGPDKADLLRAVANPDDHLHVIFATPAEPIEAHVEVMEEMSADGATLGLRGRIASGNLRGAAFAAVYDVGSRTGKLVLRRA